MTADFKHTDKHLTEGACACLCKQCFSESLGCICPECSCGNVENLKKKSETP